RLNESRPILAVPREYSGRNVSSAVQPQFKILGSGYRWFEADSGTPVYYHLNSKNASVAEGGITEFNNALSAWTKIPRASIMLQSGNLTTSCGFLTDGITSVSFGDCLKQLDDPIECRGILAIGGITSFSNSSQIVNGRSFLRTFEADVVLNDK